MTETNKNKEQVKPNKNPAQNQELGKLLAAMKSYRLYSRS